MKSSRYNPSTFQLISIITILFGLQVNFLNAAKPGDAGTEVHFTACVICSNNTPATEKESLSNEILYLEPTTPAEATFTDEESAPETEPAQTTSIKGSFDDDSAQTSPSVLEYLAPTTPPEADFKD